MDLYIWTYFIHNYIYVYIYLYIFLYKQVFIGIVFYKFDKVETI